MPLELSSVGIADGQQVAIIQLLGDAPEKYWIRYMWLATPDFMSSARRPNRDTADSMSLMTSC